MSDYSSTLPIWVVVIGFGVIMMVLMGAFSPYVSMEDRKKAEGVRKASIGIEFSGDKVPIKVRYRITLEACYMLSLLATVVADVFFVIENLGFLMGIAQKGGIIGVVAMVVSVLGLSFLAWLVLCFLAGYTMGRAEIDLVEHYERNYHVICSRG